MGVSKNNGTPKSPILIGFSIINHPFWGTPIFGNTHMNIAWNICSHPTWSYGRTLHERKPGKKPPTQEGVAAANPIVAVKQMVGL